MQVRGEEKGIVRLLWNMGKMKLLRVEVTTSELSRAHAYAIL